MDVVFGVVALVVVVLAVLGASDPGARAGGRPRTPAPSRARRPAPPPPPRRSLERERREDAAFADGVLFSHYLLNDCGDGADGGDDPYADDWDMTTDPRRGAG